MEYLNYNINKLIEEILECKSNGNYFAALTTTLILPDICSKIETKKLGERIKYGMWCERWLSNYLQKLSLSLKATGNWGQIIYKLRCGIMHNGENDLNRKDYDFFKLLSFNIFVKASKSNDIALKALF